MTCQPKKFTAIKLKMTALQNNMPTFDKQEREFWPDDGEQGHEACLFNAGAIPALPVVSAGIWIRRSDGIFFFVEHDTRQSAVDYLASLQLHQTIPDYWAAANTQAAVSGQVPQMFMGGSPNIQVILVKGTKPPPAEKQANMRRGPPTMTRTILVRPSQLMTFINRVWDDIATEHVEDHVYKLV